ncbi:MAG: 4-hydroxythreonine-4-phosphate dehydrogenase PdxA, partial [Pseudomonadota bacterium]
MSSKPVIGITMGDPCGVGPEIILKALSDPEVYETCNPVVLGDTAALVTTAKNLKTGIINRISIPFKDRVEKGQIDIIELSSLDGTQIIPGRPTVDGGKAMVGYITKAVEMALQGEIAAMVTCPINKALMNEAGYHFDGHTQLIASLTKTDHYVMMLAGERL